MGGDWGETEKKTGGHWAKVEKKKGRIGCKTMRHIKPVG